MAVTEFNVETAAQDFAGYGRRVVLDERTSDYHRGYHIWVEVKGWTLSATWDRSTYCTGAGGTGGAFPLDREPSPSSPDAEIGVWPEGGSLIELDGDTVEGWVSPAAFIEAVEAAERDDVAGIRAALVRREAA